MPVTNDLELPIGRTPRQKEIDAAFDRGWNEAIKAAAKIADEWDHHGDPGEAMYASPRIRNRIERLTRR